MKASRPTSSTPRRTLGAALESVNLGVALLAIGLAGITLTVAGLLTLRAYVDQELNLIGRSMSYTVEAAVVFGDRNAAQEAIGLIASTEEVASAEVFDQHGQLLAVWHHQDVGSLHKIGQAIAQLILPAPIMTPVMHEGVTVGTIRVVGRGDSLLLFLSRGLAGLIGCLVLSMAGALALSRRMQGGITGPLRELGDVAHAVRSERAFSRRVPPAEILELNTLGEDFNSLLDELQAWQDRLQSENQLLAHKAAHDSLTGLPNREIFEQALNRALDEASSHGGRVAALFLDSDNFKGINDGLGHAAGDAVLVNVAARVRSRLRQDDLVARLGGDEFAVLLTPLHEFANAQAIADSIVACMREPIVLPGGGSVVSSLSVGIAVFPDDARDPQGLMRAADAAMYRAKSARRDRGEPGAQQREITSETKSEGKIELDLP